MTLRAGTFSIDISPPVGYRLQGHDARRTPSTGVHDPLKLKALTLFDGVTRLALVSCDLIYFDTAFYDQVRLELHASTGLPPHHLLLAASHTHTGPAMVRYVDTCQEDYLPEYIAVVRRHVVGAVKAAMRREEAASVRLAAGAVNIGIINRRKRVDGLVVMQPNPAAPIDEQCSVLRVDRAGGSPLAILFHYTCHPTSLGIDFTEVSADYPGVAQRAIEAVHPGAQAMFFNGCCGDVRPNITRDGRFVGGTFPDTQRMGRLLAAQVLQDAERAEPVAPVRLAAKSTQHHYPFDARRLPATARRLEQLSRDAVSQLGADAAMVERWRRHWQGQLDEGHKPPRDVVGMLQCLRIGDVHLAAMPGEVMVEIGLDLRRRHGGRVLPIGCAQGQLGYIPTARAMREGGYEAQSFLSLTRRHPAPFAPSMPHDLVSALLRLAGRRGSGKARR